MNDLRKVGDKWFDIYDNEKYIEEKEKYILAKGGDGTLIKAIHLLRETKKPILGVGAGTINFLMNEKEDCDKSQHLQKFYLIKVEVFYNEYEVNTGLGFPTERKETYQAFNDVVLGEFNAWIDFDCIHEDNILGNFKGSGIIVSTSQGSTGINKNNHGTILPLSSKNWSITGMQTNRNINYVIESTNLEINCKSRGNIKLCIDGSYKVIESVKKVVLSRGDKVEVIFNDYQKFKEKRQ